MPFTLTHVLAVVPLGARCRWEVFLALAIGAMVPDVAVIWPDFSYRQFHSLDGLVTRCLPAGLLLYFWALYLGVPFLVELLPEPLARRLRPHLGAVQLTPRFVLVVALGLIIGSLTHVFWDGFTHRTGWAIPRSEFLRSTVKILGDEVPHYRVLQHASSLVGLPLLGLFVFRRLNRLDPGATDSLPGRSPKWKGAYLLGILAVPAVVVGVSWRLWGEAERTVSAAVILYLRWACVGIGVGALLHRTSRLGEPERARARRTQAR